MTIGSPSCITHNWMVMRNRHWRQWRLRLIDAARHRLCAAATRLAADSIFCLIRFIALLALANELRDIHTGSRGRVALRVRYR